MICLGPDGFNIVKDEYHIFPDKTVVCKLTNENGKVSIGWVPNELPERYNEDSHKSMAFMQARTNFAKPQPWEQKL